MAWTYLKRTLRAVFTIYVVATLTFVLIRKMPGGPVQYIIAQRMQSSSGRVDIERAKRLAELYTNLQPDKPLHLQYVDYMTSVFTGDFGLSVTSGEPVSAVLGEALPWTIFLMSVSLVVTFVVGIALGAVMAYAEGSRFDVTMSSVSIVLTSIPYYIVAIMLIYVLGYQYSVFPPGGRYSSDVTVGFNLAFVGSVLYHGALPIFSMVLTGFGGQALSMRGNSISVLGEDYLRVARLRGLPSHTIAFRYVTRNAILPMYTGLMMSIGLMFGGSVILEELFSYPGVGLHVFKAIEARDYPLMMGGFMLIAVAVIVAVLIADFTYAMIDPRAGGENREAY